MDDVRYDYDADADAVYVWRGEKHQSSHTFDTGFGIIVDIHEDGSAVGVEILNPSRLAFSRSTHNNHYE